MSTFDTVNYYTTLLILQYIGKARAVANVRTVAAPIVMCQTSIQTITFPEIPDGGSFVLGYGDGEVTINWDDSTSEIQDKLRGLASTTVYGGDAFTDPFDDGIYGGDAYTDPFGFEINGGTAYGFDLGDITVTGSIASGTLTVTFIGVTPPAQLLVLVSTSLTSGADTVTPVINEIDESLPLAVQNGFNLFGDNIAVGAQLDVLGKYAGASRTGNGFDEQITLDDNDFLTLIKLSIIENNAGSSLATIQQLIFDAFAGQITVYDYANMFMAYYISEAVASDDLLQIFVTEGKLPKPMGVGIIIVIYNPTNAFGFEGSTDSGGFGDLLDASIGGEFATLYPP